jgi:hypothetical protein
MWTGVAAFGLALAAPAKGLDIAKGPTTWSFQGTFHLPDGRPQTVAFELPARSIEADFEAGTRVPLDEAWDSVARDLRAWGAARKGPDLTVKRIPGGLQLGASGRDRAKVKETLRAAEAERDALWDAWLARHEAIEIRDGEIAPDYARIAAGSAAALGPVAAALGAETLDARAYAERALAFVQSIPYEAKLKRGGDAGFRQPLAVLGRNRADCDGKAVLFLALVRAAHPALGSAVLVIPDHALAGLALEPMKGDRDIKADGVRYVLAEPVGPAVEPLGSASGRSRRKAGGADVLVLP